MDFSCIITEMRKIFVDKNDTPGLVVEKIIAEVDEDITLVIPRNARVAESLANLHLLKKEADETGKRLIIESVSDEVLALAKAAKIPAAHPLFSVAKSRSLSDIIPNESEELPISSVKKSSKHKIPETKNDFLPARGSRKFTFRPETSEEEKTISESVTLEQDESYLYEPEPIRKSRRKKFNWRRLIVFTSVVVFFGLGIWGIQTFFARAKVRINFTEITWEKEIGILATKTVGEVDLNENIIPAEVLRDIRNTTQFFPATGRAQISEKAKGRITIYNAYSSQPQILVATTRFETPDGKIYRLDNQVVVPGAEIKDGKIVPRSIETGVTADKAGQEYNIGPVEKLVIPGFKGTARYDGFYGALLQGASGGFVGEKAVPTDGDIASAKEKMAGILKSILENNLLSGRTMELKILPGASGTEVIKMTVNKSTDDKGNFGIIGEAEFRAVAFREEDLKTLLLNLARQEYPDMDFHNLDIEYTDVRANYDKGEVRFSVKAKAELAPAFSAEEFKIQIAGKDLNSVRSWILKLPHLADAEVSVWPIWLRHLPENPEKITVILE